MADSRYPPYVLITLWLTYTLNMHQWTWQQHRLKLFPISHNHNPQWPNTVTVAKNINHQSDWWHILKQQNINLLFLFPTRVNRDQICSSNYRDESRRIIRQLNYLFLMLFVKNTLLLRKQHRNELLPLLPLYYYQNDTHNNTHVITTHHHLK